MCLPPRPAFTAARRARQLQEAVGGSHAYGRLFGHNRRAQRLVQSGGVHEGVVHEGLPVDDVEHGVGDAAGVVALRRYALRQGQPLGVPDGCDQDEGCRRRMMEQSWGVLWAHGAAAAADADTPRAVASVVICSVVQRVIERALALPVLFVPAAAG